MLYLLDMFGVAVFAVTGAMAAGRKRMDVFGIVIVALVTAIGGGTLRDLLLGRCPVFWMTDPAYLLVAAVSALLTFVCARFLRFPRLTLFLFDAMGLAVFTVVGCRNAMDFEVSSVIVVLMGMVTGVVGGIMRDILCDEIPLILCREVYATASLLGAVIYVYLPVLGVSSVPTLSVSIAAVLCVRLAALRWQLALPVFGGHKPTSSMASLSKE